MQEQDELSLKPVPQGQRVGPAAPLFNMLGANIAISELMLGGALVYGLSLGDMIMVSIAGNFILVVLLMAQGYIGYKEGLNTYMLTKGAFGELGGKYLISLLLGITSFGWFGVQAGVAGLSMQKIFPDINLTAAVIVLGLLMMLFAVVGFKAMAKFNYLAIPPLVILMAWGIYEALDIFGVDSIINHTPKEPMSIVSGLNSVIGLVIVGAIVSPDQLRFSRSAKDVFIIGLVGIGLVSIFQQVAAGIMATGAPSADITEVLANLGFGFIAFSILILAAWSTNVANAYSGGLALKTMLPNVKRTHLTLLAGLIGTGVAASGIIFKFIEFLSFLSYAVPAIAGIMWSEYYLLRKRTFVVRPGVNVIAILCWIAGFLVSYFSAKGEGFLIPPVNGLLAAGLLYFLLMPLFDKKTPVNKE